MISTQLTQIMSITCPIALAPMGGVADGTLAGATAAAGGIGFIGMSPYKAEWLKQEIKKAEEISQGKGALGVGFIQWLMMELPEHLRLALLDTALASPSIKALWFSFGPHAPLVPYIRSKRPDILIFHQLHSVHEAVESLRAGTADVIVAQGSEAGGHGKLEGTGTGIMVLLPEIVQAVKKWEREEGKGKKVPVLAAGGLTLPTQLAACLLLGASGIVLGTRLMVCDESPLSQDWKRCVIETKESGETVRTLLYDRLRMGSMKQGWEKLGYDGRLLRTPLVAAYHSQPPRDQAITEAQLNVRGGFGKLGKDEPMWAGQGSGLITQGGAVKGTVEEMVRGAEEVLGGAAGTFVSSRL